MSFKTNNYNVSSNEMTIKLKLDNDDVSQYTSPSDVSCYGFYRKHTKVKACLKTVRSINNFYIISKTLTKEQEALMDNTATLRYRSGALMCSARPYTSDIGQIKLYKSRNRNGTSLVRCQIKDLYTIAESNQLTLKADIQFVDDSPFVKGIDFNLLYDFPQNISFFKDIEPGAKKCRLHLGHPVPLEFESEEINKYFLEAIGKGIYDVEVLDYKNDIYHVDIFNKTNSSMIQHLRQKFRHIIETFELKSIFSKENHRRINADEDQIGYMNEVHSYYGRGNNSSRLNSSRNLNGLGFINERFYSNAIVYFQELMKRNIKNSAKFKSNLQRSLFKVKVLWWQEPDSIFIIPDDPDYTKHHPDFRNELSRYQAFRDDNDYHHKQNNDKEFIVGDKCIFLNDNDPHLGKWLRGVVTKAPNFGVLKGSKLDDSMDMWNPEFFVYGVQSIDYGFSCIRSKTTMRHVKNEMLFSCKGPWSLKCRLFGINPLTNETKKDGSPKYCGPCLDFIDSWMRQRIINNGRDTSFYILFRTNIFTLADGWQSSAPMAEISLFHRFEPPYRLEDCISKQKRKPRFDCLNTLLVDKGVAADYIHKVERSSKVDLDHFILNLMVQHDRI